MSRKMRVDEVIEAYVLEVVRRVPGADRAHIGFELRGLLAEMLEDRARGEGREADDAMVLAMLREFGLPAEVAARYRPPGLVMVPAGQTRAFALTAVGGLLLQWALTLPHVFAGDLSVSGWWLGPGLGAFWWPGFMAIGALLAAWLRSKGWAGPKWRQRSVDPDRVNRGALAFGLAWFAFGAGFVASLPWLAARMPGALPQVFAFDPEFLRVRAWPVLVLWAGSFASLAIAYANGRRTALSRRLETGFGLAWVALLGWWAGAGGIFLAKASDEGARGALVLVIAIIVVDLLAKAYQRRTRIHAPKPAG